MAKMKLGKNSFIGIGLILVAIVLAMVVGYFRYAVAVVQADQCGMTVDECPHAKNIPPEVFAGYTIAIVIGAIGAYLVIGDFRSARFRTQSAQEFHKVAGALRGEEKTLYDLVASSDGVMFQSDLVDKSGLQKVKVSRVLDKLEAQGLLERRRRGMSNVVVLKNK
jgi:hypothetical protein